MTPKQRIVSYFLITNFVWGISLVWLIPFQLIIVGLNWEQFVKWIVLGTIIQLFIAYIVTKIIVWGVPKIEKWVKNSV